MRMHLSPWLPHDPVQQEEIRLAFFIVIQQVNSLHPFLQVIDDVIVEIRLQYIFHCRPKLFFYINDIRKNGRLMVPLRVLVKELDTFRITFHRIDEALQQIMLVILRIQFATFIRQLLPQYFHLALGL